MTSSQRSIECDPSISTSGSTLDVSCWTFIRMAQLAEPLMRKGGTPFHNDVLRQPDGRQKLQHHRALPRPPLNPQFATSQPSWDRRASASMPSLQDRSQRAQHQGFPNLMHYSTRLRQRRRHAAWLAWPPPFLHMMRRGSSRGKRFMSTVAITSSINEPYGASLSADL